MRLMLMAALGTVALASSASAQNQNTPEDRQFCTHATSQVNASCPSLGPRVSARMARVNAVREGRELREAIDAALADGRCEDARKIAVDKGRHELAARLRRACAAAS